jgi:hypothetical protein
MEWAVTSVLPDQSRTDRSSRKIMMDREGRALQSTPEEGCRDDDRSRYRRRRLLIEAAIEEGYLVRLERRLATGRISTRIVQPVALEAPDGDTTGKGTLVTRTSDRRQTTTTLDDGDEVSIVTTRFRAEDERRGPWRVGDAVRDTQFGMGVVQAFRHGGDGALVVVRFDADGPKRLPLERAELRPLR